MWTCLFHDKLWYPASSYTTRWHASPFQRVKVTCHNFQCHTFVYHSHMSQFSVSRVLDVTVTCHNFQCHTLCTTVTYHNFQCHSFGCHSHMSQFWMQQFCVPQSDVSFECHSFGCHMTQFWISQSHITILDVRVLCVLVQIKMWKQLLYSLFSFIK